MDSRRENARLMAEINYLQKNEPTEMLLREVAGILADQATFMNAFKDKLGGIQAVAASSPVSFRSSKSQHRLRSSLSCMSLSPVSRDAGSL